MNIQLMFFIHSFGKKNTMIIYDTIKKYSEIFNNKTSHPLINLVDLNKSNPLERTKFMLSFYAIIIKETHCGDIRYGNKYYDYSDGSMVFFSPNQIISNEPEGELHQPYGKALIFHPDIIKGTSLGKQIHEYSFFGYQSKEALHLSDREREIVNHCFENITIEINQNIDRHSKKLIVANLELLLKYCSRFYDRQFITRENTNHGIIEQFDSLLKEYFFSEKLKAEGLPSVAYFADELHLSANYFGDLIKKETGKSALEHIQTHLIDLAKERIFDTSKSLSEISYELGFKYPQHFTRYFKQKTGVSPIEYRGLN
jgi:AraC-like DNA-binding protein